MVSTFKKEINQATKFRKKIKLFWRLMRPHQWLKNSFVLSGLFFGHIWSLSSIFKATNAVLAFICVASAGYIFNDLRDQQSDHQHPQKKHRPIASQELSSTEAIISMIILLVVGLCLGFYLSIEAFGLLLIYFCLVLAYSLKLKHIPWIEILCVVFGFLFRILLGTWGIQIAPSIWVISCGFWLAMFLILTKRYSEQQIFKSYLLPLRKSLSFYNEGTLQKFVYGSAIFCFIVYSFYAITHGFALTILFVGLGIWRYIALLKLRSEQGIELDVASEFFKDRFLQCIILCWVGSVSFLLFS